jgi:hypothetical protein
LASGGHEVPPFEQLTLHEDAVLGAGLRRRVHLLAEALDGRDLRFARRIVLVVRVRLVQIGDRGAEQCDEHHRKCQPPPKGRRVVVEFDLRCFDVRHRQSPTNAMLADRT